MATSNDEKSTELEELVKRLLFHATPDSNDRRHQEYISYINTFLGCFAVEQEMVLGKERVKFLGKEEVMMAGSTAEQTKLRTEKDGGDADFILISGVAVIPVSLLVPRKETPSFVWILGEELQDKLNVHLEDGKYLPSSLLRSVRPELFSHLRAIYKLTTVMQDYIPEDNSRVVTTGESSKVGLARHQYRKFEVDESVLPPQPKTANFQSSKRKTKILKKLGSSGLDTLKKFMKLLASFKTPGSTGSHQSPFLNFTYILHQAMKEEEEQEAAEEDEHTMLQMANSSDQDAAVMKDEQAGDEKQLAADQHGDDNDENDSIHETFENDLDASSVSEVVEGVSTLGQNSTSREMRQHRTVVARYHSKTSKDFVPAFRVLGLLPCMPVWLNRSRRWPPENIVQAIYQTEIYVVAKRAPVDSDEGKDFCLSFNRAEIMLAKALSPVQKNCLLILKSFSKGILKDVDQKYDGIRSTKLTTFHWKTALYWVSEDAAPELWTEERLEEAVVRVIQFIRSALEKTFMPHFFILSNLLAGMDHGYRLDMIEAIQRIEQNPIKCIGSFFTREDNFGPDLSEVTLSEEVVMRLQEIRDDGGQQDHVDTVRDALVDIQRGFDRGPKDQKGEPPVEAAMNKVLQLYLEDEITRALQREMEKLSSPEVSAGSAAGTGAFLSGIVGTSTSFQQFLGATDKEEEEKRMDEVKYHGSSFYFGKPE